MNSSTTWNRVSSLGIEGQVDAIGASAGQSIFTSLEWFDLLARTTLPNSVQPVYLVRNGIQSRECLALITSNGRAGKRLESMSNFYSPIYDACAPAASAAELSAVLADLAASAASRVDIVHLRPFDADSELFDAARKALGQAGFWVDTHLCFGNWYLKVNGQSFAQYFSTRPTVIRKNVPRARRRLEERGMRIEIFRQESEALGTAVRQFEDVYANSWRNRKEPHPHFVEELCRLAARRGWLRLGLMTLDGMAIAAQIWLMKDGVASIFKVAYRETYAKYSVGSVLTCELMRMAMEEDHVDTVDFLSGDDTYKREWMSDRRERWGMVAFNRRSPRGVLAALRHYGARAAKATMGAKVEKDVVAEKG